MLKSFKHFVPLAALVTLASVMAFAPKIGPVVLACALVAAALPTLQTMWRDRSRGGMIPAVEATEIPGPARDPVIVALLFMALAAVSLVWAPEGNFALSRSIRLFGFLVTVTIYALMFARAGGVSQRHLRPLALLASSGFALAALCLALSFALIVPTKASPDAFVNRSVVILSLSSFAFAAYVWSARWPIPAKVALTALLGLVSLGFSLFSNSQTSTVALLCGWLAIVIFKPATAKVRRWLVAAIAGLGFAAPLLIVLATALPDTLLQSAFLKQGSAAHRLNIWDSYLALVREKPLFGWGLEGSRDFDPSLLAAPATTAKGLAFASHPHNAFLQVWTDLGGVGALLFCVLVALLGRRIEHARSEARAPIYGLFAAILTTSAVSHGAFQSWWLASVGVLAVAVFPLAAPSGTKTARPDR